MTEQTNNKRTFDVTIEVESSYEKPSADRFFVQRAVQEGITQQLPEFPRTTAARLVKMRDHAETSSITVTYDSTSGNWAQDPLINRHFLRGVETYLQNAHQVRGHLFLNEVLDELGLNRSRIGATSGWYNTPMVMSFENPDEYGSIEITFVLESDIHNNLP